MARFLVPVLFLALAIGSFFLYTKPQYNEGLALRDTVAKLEDAQTNMQKVLEQKQQLLNNYNSLQKEDIDRLEKLMPDNLDNIKLIIDIDNTAKKYGMVLNAVKFDVDAPQKSQPENIITGRPSTVTVVPTSNTTAATDNNDYNSFGFGLTITGSFDNFNKLLADIEKNLRIVDISSVTFDASDTKDVYKYEVKAKIYWLKNTQKLDI